MAFDTSQPAQVSGLNGYTVDPLVTMGDEINGYFPPGIPDGMGAIELDENTVRLFVNHELTNTSGYAYTLDSGAALVGARVSYFDIDKTSRTVVDAGLAYDTIYNRAGEVVDDASDLEFGGLNRFCSAQLIPAEQFGAGNGLVDTIFFTGEETGGGTEFALDVTSGELWAVPWMGRAAWESVTELDTSTTDKVALLVGDDRTGAPLLLYVGEKNAVGDGSFLDRNGLAQGQLYVWVADNADVDPSQFKGTFASRDGRFVEIDYYRPDLAGNGDYDELGFATQAKQDALAAEAGAFKFSRPEDVSTDPNDGTRAVMASTGSGLAGGADLWGTTYLIDADFSDLNNITAKVDIAYDGDDAGNGQFAGPDFGLRSPDNLDWADDGHIYIQEDRSVNGFGATSGEEASIWKLDPASGELTRVAQMNRDNGVPDGQTDGAVGSIGNWESSGIIDVSTLFAQDPGELFLFNVQAHSLRDGVIAQEGLVEGGQIAFLADPAELVGFASLPADTFAEGPATGAGISGNGRTGPFAGPPVQGFSGVQFAPGSDGSTFWFLSDNGFGSKTNSADYLLRLYQVDPNFAGSEAGDGAVEVQGFVQLSDPNNLIPFDITNEGSSDRLLTGADFDIESFVIAANGDIWIGEEFGPYILHFDAKGVLLEAPIPTPNREVIELNTLNGQDPLVIGHRGASGTLPEHTLEAYALAIELGADFIEPDLVITKDGVLIARHEPMLDDTTNVAEVFGPERQSTKLLDGEEVTAYFAEDFTLAEIKQLRAVQQLPFRDQSFNGQFEIPTFQEVIELLQQVEADTGKKIGIYPETKHPTFFDEQGLSLEEPLVATLLETGFTDPNRIFIQSFEVQNLLELNNDLLPAAGLGDVPVVQLLGDFEDAFINENGGGFSVPYDFVANAQSGDLRAIYGDLVDLIDFSTAPTYADLANPEVIDFIGAYAEGIGPWKNSFLLREPLDTPVDGNGDGVAQITTQLTGEVLPLIEWAHDAGMQVHPYTLRDEERYLTLNPDGTPQTPQQEFEQLIQLGVDGFFTDFPGTGDQVRDQIVADLVRSPDNPDVLAGDEVANLPRSRGYEGMAFSPDRATLYPMLEGSVVGDPEGSLRIYEFDVASAAFQGLVGLYQMEAASHAIGDFTPINDDEFLVIERDGGQGEAAEFKKIFKVDLSNINSQGFVGKEEVVDLLNINDPNDLNGDGETTFDFPFVTIEDVLVLDKDTILVANDNNYPFSVGRGPDIDNNEIIKIKLDKSLNLDDRLGAAAAALPTELIDLTGFDGIVTANVTLSREAGFDNILKFYQTDAKGAVGGILPGEANYELAVQASLLNSELFVENLATADDSINLIGGSYYAPALLIDGDLNNLATIGDNALGISRIQRDGNVWRFEDWTDNDFNDLVLTLNSADAIA